jgi:hypothetical protein
VRLGASWIIRGSWVPVSTLNNRHRHLVGTVDSAASNLVDQERAWVTLGDLGRLSLQYLS